MQQYLSKGHWYFTRIMSRLHVSIALNNRLTWHYLRVTIFMSTPLPSTQKTQNEKMTEINNSVKNERSIQLYLKCNHRMMFNLHIYIVLWLRQVMQNTGPQSH